MAKICNHCGAMNNDNTLVCTRCKKTIVGNQTAKKTNKDSVSNSIKKVMMFCPNCGGEVQPGDLFCENCGFNVNQTNMHQDFNTNSDVNSYNPIKKPMSKNKKIIIALIAVLIVISAGIGYYFYTQPKEINAQDYISVNFEGYDTVGKGTASIKRQKLEKKLISTARNIAPINKEEQLDELVRCIKLKLSKEDNIANGDKVVLSFGFDNDTAQKYGIRFVGTDLTYEVDSLYEIKEVDPFKDVKINYEGISPNIVTTLKNNTKDDYLAELDYELSKYENIKKGEKITVTITNGDNCLEENGYKLTSLEKTYIVDGGLEYISKISDISEKEFTKLKDQAEDEITAYSTSNDEEFIVGKVTYVGNYLLKTKDEDSYDEDNVLYLIYSATISPVPDEDYYEFDKQTIYFAVAFYDLLNTGKNKIEYSISEDPLVGSSDIDDGPSFSGYTNVEHMYNELVGENVDDYTASMQGDLRK